MTGPWLLGFCVGLGLLAARYARPPPGLAPALNWFVLNVALPCMVLRALMQLHFQWQFWFLVVSMWIVFGGAWMLIAWIGRRYGWTREVVGALVLVAGLGNTAFVGYPVIQALRGTSALGLAVIADQCGSFLALAVGGAIVAGYYSGQLVGARAMLTRTLRFPPALALLIALALHPLGHWPSVLGALFDAMTATVTPLALFAVGLQLRLRWPAGQEVYAGVALGWKLVLAPAVAFAVARVSGVHGAVLTVGVLQSAMPPMITAAVVAEQAGLDGPLATMTLGLGLALSALELPLLNRLL